MRRHEYVYVLGSRTEPPRPSPADLSLRHLVREDAGALAQLMLDAYLDTIDYEGETIEQARQEVAGYFDGTPMLDCSWLRIAGGLPISALLVSSWGGRACPIVSYVMTTPARKGTGLASDLLERSLASLAEAGHGEVRAIITEGNLPSEAIFARSGFRRV
jgi:GNAT superfamily N-acetyltransferase